MRNPLLFGLVVGLVGCAHTLEGPCPEIDAVYNAGSPDRPATVVSVLASSLVIEGEGFEVLPRGLSGKDVDIPEVHLEMGSQSSEGTVAYVSDRELAVTFTPEDPALQPGLYDLVVTNPNGCEDRFKEAVEVVESALDDSILVAEIIPPFGWTEQDTAVTIRGDGFVSTPRAWLSVGDYARDWELDQVAFIDATSLTGVVPAGIPVGGPYDVIVENPDGGFNLLEDGFLVTENAPPDIQVILPEAGNTQSDTEVVITGENFDPNIAVSLYDIDGNVVDATVNSATATQIDATFPTSGGLGVGAWIVRATNPDETWDEYAAFVNRNPSAKLGTAGAWAESEPLQTARVGLGLVSHVDDLGRGFLYAVGGSDGTGPLDTVERARTDAFGTISRWETLGTRMTIPRAHGAVLQHDGWIYAIGGDDGAGSTASAEKARILTDDADLSPTITEDEVTQDAGTLAEGTWYYRVAGVMGGNDPVNPGGETPASNSYVVRVDVDGSAVRIVWDAVPGAVHYRIYRTDEVNGAAGEEHRIADEVTGTEFTDDGLPAGTETFVPIGGLGEWIELTDPLPGPWAHGAGVIGRDANDDPTFFLVGGWDGGNLLGDVYAMDPTDETWFVPSTLEAPRADNMAAVCGPDQAQNLGAGAPNYLLAMEGDTGAGAENNIVFAEILIGGSLGPWQTLSSQNAGGQARMDGIGLAAAGHLYILGGGGSPTESQDSARQSEVQGPVLDMGSWSSSSASGTFAVPRADFSVTQLRATLYAAGGRTDGSAAMTSVEQVVF